MYEPDDYETLEEDRLFPRDGSEELEALDADDAEPGDTDVRELADPDEDDAQDLYQLT